MYPLPGAALRRHRRVTRCVRPPAAQEHLTAMLDFSRLQTPPNDGDVLVEPSRARLALLAESNHRLLNAYAFDVLDTDAQTLRAELRDALRAGRYAPVVITGHQPEFIHAGVWAKHVVASKLAESFDGKAVNFVVDNDAPARTVLETPTVIGAEARVEAVRYARLKRGVAHEFIPRLETADLRHFETTVRRHLAERFDRSCLPVYFTAMTRDHDARDWVEQMVHARRAVERDFGVEMIEHRVSRNWFGPVLADLIVNHARFVECYNAALADYRKTNRVRSPNRPIPDLVCAGLRCELPVWAYRPGEPRRRLLIERDGDRVHLFADAERIAEIGIDDLKRWGTARAALGRVNGYLFRPRALTLTLWARVFVGDLFIHGIGGAKYDRITDGLIRRYYGVEPPAMACVSATLRMDLPRDDADALTLRDARSRVRDLRYNPQRHVRPTPETARLMDERRAAVAHTIELRDTAGRDRVRRREAFDRIRAINAELLEHDPSRVTELDAASADIRRRLGRNAVARRRDFFFAMHDRNRLEQLRDKLTATVALGV